MAVKKGDILDEFKRHPGSCGLLVKIMAGGEGFEKVICCDHELTDEDVVTEIRTRLGRKRGRLPMAVVLDEKKLYPDSCGLRVMIMDGGAGFKEILCCGHSLTLTAMRSLDLGQGRGTTPAPGGPSGSA
jgi:hypothetical protein